MIGKVYICAVIGICIILVIKSSESKMSFPVSVICSLSILITTVPFFAKIISVVKYAGSDIKGIDNFIYLPLIIIASEYLGSICLDIGEKSLAQAITVFTKTAVIASSVVMLSDIMDIIKGFTG